MSLWLQSHQSAERDEVMRLAGNSERSLWLLWEWQRPSVYEKVGGNWLTVQKTGSDSPRSCGMREQRPSLPREVLPFLCDSAIFLTWGRRPQKTV